MEKKTSCNSWITKKKLLFYFATKKRKTYSISSCQLAKSLACRTLFWCVMDWWVMSSSTTFFPPKLCSPTAGWFLDELHLGVFFFHSKSYLKDTTYVFQTTFLVKKEFQNVTRKLVSLPQAKKLWGNIRSPRQVFLSKRENGHWDRKVGCLFTKKKKGKIIVSVTVNSFAPSKKIRLSDRHLGKWN